MEHRLEINQCKTILVKSKEVYSMDYLLVRINEVYEFKVGEGEKWTDWFIKTDANGFSNWLLRDKNKRVPESKCFKLCGTIGKDEENHFSIGAKKKWVSTVNDKLYFFANDSKKLNKKGEFRYYKNNKGQIRLRICRIQ